LTFSKAFFRQWEKDQTNCDGNIKEVAMYSSIAVQEIAQIAHALSLNEKLELIKLLLNDVPAQTDIHAATPLRSAYGICADLQPVPTGEDIARMRQEVFRNFPREHWLSLMRANQPIGGFVRFPRKVGMELEDGQGKPIGYLGIEYLQETSSLQGNERDLFQQTAALIEAALLQPIDVLTSRAEN
jgi:hypothetical protein